MLDLGEGLTAAHVPVDQVVAVTAAPDGGVLINSLGRLSRIDPQGRFLRLSGAPATEASADGLPARDTGLRWPIARVWDSEGRLLVSEYHRLLRLEGDGRYKEIWPEGELKVAGVVPAEGGAVLVFAEDPASKVFSLWRISSDMSRERLVTFGAGDTAILDSTSELYYPAAVDWPCPRSFARDATGRLLVWAPDAVYEVDIESGTLLERLAFTERPTAMDARGNLFFHAAGSRTLEVRPPDGERRAVEGELPEGFRLGYASMGDDGAVLLTGLIDHTRSHHPIYRVAGGQLKTLTGPMADLADARHSQSLAPTGLVSEPTGAVIVSDKLFGRLIRVAPDGALSWVGGKAGGPVAADGLSLREVALDPGPLGRDGQGRLYLVNRQEDRYQVLRVDAQGVVTVRQSLPLDMTSASFEVVEDLAVAPDGTLYLLQNRYEKPRGWFEHVGCRVVVIDDEGERTLSGHSPVIDALGIDTQGQLVMRGREEIEPEDGPVAHTLWRESEAGGLTAIATWQQAVGIYRMPGLAVDAQGRIYQAGGPKHGAIYRLDPATGETETIAGPGGGSFSGQQPDDSVRVPAFPVLDPYGRLVFLDTLHGQIKQVDAEAL